MHQIFPHQNGYELSRTEENIHIKAYQELGRWVCAGGPREKLHLYTIHYGMANVSTYDRAGLLTTTDTSHHNCMAHHLAWSHNKGVDLTTKPWHTASNIRKNLRCSIWILWFWLRFTCLKWGLIVRKLQCQTQSVYWHTAIQSSESASIVCTAKSSFCLQASRYSWNLNLGNLQ